ncbi:RNA-directed DNA polymerase, eukaryota, reverse transcriptase zinc-binding domain protein [Tanacetum coccineum]
MYRLIDRNSYFRNFWDVPLLNDSCWGWRKILQCRELIRDHIVYLIGDGSQTSIWFDNLLALGPLSQFISKRDVYEAGLALDCKLCDIIDNGVWLWPDSWRKDKVLWKSNHGKVGKFSISVAWSELLVSKPKVLWYKLVWFSQNIPRHAFIFWLAIQQRLKTQDRIEVWQGSQDVKCSLCEYGVESQSHLFFECRYSLEVWRFF